MAEQGLISQENWQKEIDYQKETAGGAVYFRNKEDFSKMVEILKEMDEKLNPDFFNNRLLLLCRPPEKEDDLNQSQVIYAPFGKNEEYAWLTTYDSSGKLANFVQLPLSEAYGEDSRLQSAIAKGDLKVSQYEQEYLDRVTDLCKQEDKEMNRVI